MIVKKLKYVVIPPGPNYASLFNNRESSGIELLPDTFAHDRKWDLLLISWGRLPIIILLKSHLTTQ